MKQSFQVALGILGIELTVLTGLFMVEYLTIPMPAATLQGLTSISPTTEITSVEPVMTTKTIEDTRTETTNLDSNTSTYTEPVLLITDTYSTANISTIEGDKTETDTSATINDVAEVIQTIDESRDTIEGQLVDQINQSIDASITTITSSTSTTSQVIYELNEQKQALIRDVDSTLKINNLDATTVRTLGDNIDSTLKNIETVTKTTSNQEIDLSRKRTEISNVIKSLEDQVAIDKVALENRNGLAIFSDADSDGVSDFDETEIFGTDPENPSTTGGLTDGEKILQGINPLATSTNATTTRIEYEHPTTTPNVLTILAVTDIAVTETITTGPIETAAKIAFKGKALPNSYITLYIYSTPIIVTVKTNTDGEWSYELDRELEDGRHEVYVAMVNNSGRVVARSNAIPFVKQAAAVEMVLDNTEPPQSFLRQNAIFVGLGALLGAIIIAVVAIGLRRRTESTEPPSYV